LPPSGDQQELKSCAQPFQNFQLKVNLADEKYFFSPLTRPTCVVRVLGEKLLMDGTVAADAVGAGVSDKVEQMIIKWAGQRVNGSED
jgi:hypothetical protein